MIKWLKKSFEYRGKASARKLTTFVAFVLLNIGFLDHIISGQLIQIEFIYIYSIIVLLGLAFLTAENLVAMVKGVFGRNQWFMDYEQDIYTKPRVDNPDGMRENPGEMGEDGIH